MSSRCFFIRRSLGEANDIVTCINLVKCVSRRIFHKLRITSETTYMSANTTFARISMRIRAIRHVRCYERERETEREGEFTVKSHGPPTKAFIGRKIPRRIASDSRRDTRENNRSTTWKLQLRGNQERQ